MSTSQVHRIPMKQFRKAAKSDMAREGPIIVTSDGADAFAVVSFDLLQEWHRRLAEKAVCPHCGKAHCPRRLIPACVH